MTTLVLVGNAKQPFSRLLEAVKSISHDLPQPVIVQHGSTPFAHAACQAYPFIAREFLSALIQKAELVICHAGAGSVIEALRAGRIPVVMSRRQDLGEHIDDHQSEFAAMLAKVKKAIVIREPADLRRGVSEALSIANGIRIAATEPPLVALIRTVLRKAAA